MVSISDANDVKYASAGHKIYRLGLNTFKVTYISVIQLIFNCYLHSQVMKCQKGEAL